MSTRLQLLCTGTPRPLAHRGGTSTLVRTAGQTLLVDCGPGCVQRLLQAGVAVTAVDHLLLTHLHYDHCVDYPYLALVRWDQGAGRIPELHVTGPAPLQRMTDRLLAADGAFGPDLAARVGHPGSHAAHQARGGVLPRRPPRPRVTEVGHASRLQGDGWCLEVAEVVHVQPQLTCLAFRLTTATGETIVFGGDTAPTPRLTELARGADVLLHMCHYLNDDGLDPRLTACCSGHLDAAHTARQAGVRTLVLVHLPEAFDDPAVAARAVREARAVFDGQVILGQDLLEVAVGGQSGTPA